MTQNNKIRELLIGFAVLLVTLVIIFIIAEITARIFVPANPTKFDAETGSIHIPNEVINLCTEEFCHEIKINSEGHIDSEFRYEQPSIMVLGDSFMAAEQVASKDSLHQRLESKLIDEYNTGEVLNYGHDGFGPGQYLIMQKKYATADTDVILFFTYLGNDFKNLYLPLSQECKPYFLVEEGKLVKQPVNCAPSGVKTKIKDVLRRSRFILFLYTKLSLILQSDALKDNNTYVPADYLVYEKQNSDYQKSFEIFNHIVKEAKTHADSIGAEFVLVTIPAPESMNEERWQKILKAYPSLQKKELDPMLPIIKVREACESINCIHLYDHFVRHEGEALYFEIDGHWNESGHKLATDIIYRKLKELNILNSLYK